MDTFDMRNRKKILVVGGSGYLGQRLLLSFLSEVPFPPHVHAFTYSSSPLRDLGNGIPRSRCFRVDLRTGDGFNDVLRSFGQPDVVVNCAAISVPRDCEADPAAAMSINVPFALLDWMSGFKEKNTLLIQLSSDQVYEGTNSFYKEEDETLPVNLYGRSKLEAEKLISAKWSNYAILRSSIIIGPQPLAPVSRPLLVQSVDKALAKGNKVDFFCDEFRCPVHVSDVEDVIRTLSKRWLSDGKPMQLVLNVGGPDRLSRAEMAEAVADFRKYSSELINPIPASLVYRGVRSPVDISMDISKFVEVLGRTPVTFADAVRMTLRFTDNFL